MNSSSLGDNKITQIGLVVENIDDAVQSWSRLLGVAPPSIILTDAVEFAHTQYQGKPTPARAKLAFFNLGQVTLELIQPMGAPSAWNDQLSVHGPSLHHIAFEIKDMEEHIQSLVKLGWRLAQHGDYHGGRYAYLDGHKQFGAVIELLENEPCNESVTWWSSCRARACSSPNSRPAASGGPTCAAQPPRNRPDILNSDGG